MSYFIYGYLNTNVSQVIHSYFYTTDTFYNLLLPILPNCNGLNRNTMSHKLSMCNPQPCLSNRTNVYANICGQVSTPTVRVKL